MVDRVAKLGVTVIVPSHYSRVTAAAQGYGKMKSIRVLDSMKQFFAILHTGDSY